MIVTHLISFQVKNGYARCTAATCLYMAVKYGEETSPEVNRTLVYIHMYIGSSCECSVYELVHYNLFVSGTLTINVLTHIY